jgi:hypothetical protein
MMTTRENATKLADAIDAVHDANSLVEAVNIMASALGCKSEVDAFQQVAMTAQGRLELAVELIEAARSGGEHAV